MNLNQIILVILSVGAANLPFLTEKVFLVWSRPEGKHFGWRLLELIVLYFAVGGLAYWLEGRMGPVHPKGWEFYAVTFSLFVVFAFPGFVYRYLWHSR